MRKIIQLKKGQKINVVTDYCRRNTEMGMGMEIKNNSENENILTDTMRE